MMKKLINSIRSLSIQLFVIQFGLPAWRNSIKIIPFHKWNGWVFDIIGIEYRVVDQFGDDDLFRWELFSINFDRLQISFIGLWINRNVIGFNAGFKQWAFAFDPEKRAAYRD